MPPSARCAAGLLGLALGLAPAAVHALPGRPAPRPSTSAADIPELEALLAAAGWTPTPELSGAFEVGRVFRPTERGHRTLIEGCFDTPPTENTYTATELVSSLQGGVRVGWGAGSARARGSVVRKVRFGTPTHAVIPELALVPTPACAQRLREAEARGLDLGPVYVVQEALMAAIDEQTCGRVDAAGGFVGLGAVDAELATACAQTSLEPVAVAYRTVPIADVLRGAAAPPLAAAPAPVGAPSPDPAPAAPREPAPAAPAPRPHGPLLVGVQLGTTSSARVGWRVDRGPLYAVSVRAGAGIGWSDAGSFLAEYPVLGVVSLRTRGGGAGVDLQAGYGPRLAAVSAGAALRAFPGAGRTPARRRLGATPSVVLGTSWTPSSAEGTHLLFDVGTALWW